MQAAVLVFPGAEELDVFAPYEVLAVAREFGANFEPALVSVGSVHALQLAKGCIVQPHRCHTDVPSADLVIVPGGGWASRARVGVRSESENPETIRFLQQAHATGAVVASVCTGTMLLLQAGLLRNIPAITHHSAVEDLRAAGVTIQPSRVVDAGSIITSGGVTSGLDIALWMVERFTGVGIAEKVARYLEYERRGEVWQASQE